MTKDMEEADAIQKGKRKTRIPSGAKIIRRDFYPDDLICGCSERLKSISADIYTRTDRIPEQIVVFKDRYNKCACGKCKDGVRRAKVNRFLSGNCKLENDIINKLAIQKHFEYTPVQRNWWKLHIAGYNISRQTLNRLVNMRAKQFLGIADAITSYVLSGHALYMDETFVRITNPKKDQNSGNPTQGTCFVVGRDETRYNPETPRAVFFHFSMSRAGAVPRKLISGTSIIALHCDGHPLYNGFIESMKVQNCWAHARRYFERAKDGPGRKLANGVLRAIGAMYHQEKKLWGASSLHRLAERQRLISPIPDLLKKSSRKRLRLRMDVSQPL